jgi:hypothetical protein
MPPGAYPIRGPTALAISAFVVPDALIAARNSADRKRSATIVLRLIPDLESSAAERTLGFTGAYLGAGEIDAAAAATAFFGRTMALFP